MIGRLVLALPLVVVSVALGLATQSFELAGVVAGIALAAALVGERWEMDRGRQFVASAMGGGVGWAAAAILYEFSGGLLSEVWARIGAAMILAAAARALPIRPIGGRAGTIALAFAGLLAIGETRASVGYEIAVVAFVGASLASLRMGDPDRPPLATTSMREIAAASLLLVVAAGIGLGAVAGLRRAHQWALRRASAVAFAWHPKTGFSETMDLGALDGLLDSDEVVLRVRGARVDYLRGLAFDVYEPGRWVRSQAAATERKETWSDPPTGDAIEIDAVSDRVERLFLPFAARSVASSPPLVRVDGLGAARRVTTKGLLTARFVRGDRDRAAIAAPTATDRLLPPRVRLELAPVAEAWTAGAETTEAKLDAIENRLAREYRYARAFDRPLGQDPALAFLLHDKRGHCEYFATAMALVARAAKIPARLVTGYRVAERSPFADQWIVRQRNAHAWVEVWIEGKGWVTRDPTPESFVPQNHERESSIAAALLDVARVRWSEWTTWLSARTVTETALASLVGFAVLAWIVARGVRRRPATERPLRDDEAPLDFAEKLLEALARAGFPRADGESIEHLAERVDDQRAKALLRRYAALRYGGQGDPRALADDVGAHLRQG